MPDVISLSLSLSLSREIEKNKKNKHSVQASAHRPSARVTAHTAQATKVESCRRAER